MLSLRKDIIGLEIKDEYINLIYGNKNNIKHYGNIKIDSNACIDGRILDSDEIINKLKQYLKEKKINNNKVSYIVNGSDVITRYIELPIMKEDALRETVYFEFGQFIKELDLYYMDYEILEKVNLKDKKGLKVLLVACPKNKIDSLIELSNRMGFKTQSIDIITNSIYRVIKNSYIFNEDIHSLGVFYFGYRTSTFFIMEKQIICVDKMLHFGMFNILKALQQTVNLNSSNEYKFNSLIELFENSLTVKNNIDNVMDSINNIIQFYTDGKARKMLDKIIIVSEFDIYSDVESYISNAYGTECKIIREKEDLGIKAKNTCKIPKTISTYGLFLRSK